MFWTSDGVCLGYSVRIRPLTCMLYCLHTMDSSDSLLGGQYGSRTSFTHLLFQAVEGLELVS